MHAEATRNRKNEPDQGSTSCARMRPAMKVPPQKTAVRKSLM